MVEVEWKDPLDDRTGSTRKASAPPAHALRDCQGTSQWICGNARLGRCGEQLAAGQGPEAMDQICDDPFYSGFTVDGTNCKNLLDGDGGAILC